MASILAALQDPDPNTAATITTATTTTTQSPPPTTDNKPTSEGEDKQEEEEDAYVAPMDRTIAPVDATEIVDGMESLYHVGTSNVKITYLGGLEKLAPSLIELSLRSNLIRRLDGIEHLSNLVTIELADNLIRKMGPMNLSKTCPMLTTLDLSYNQIRRIENISGLIHLKHLYVANNKLTTIGMEEGLGSIPCNLKRLDLGYNRIRHMENLPPSLEELWLGKNKITVIKGLSTNDGSLRILDVQSNRLVSLTRDSASTTAIQKKKKSRENGKDVGGDDSNTAVVDQSPTTLNGESETKVTSGSDEKSTSSQRDDEKGNMIGLNLNCLSNLEELYLSHQGITDMDGLQSLVSLHTLDLSANKITELKNMSTLLKLEEFWMNDNLIETFETIKSELIPLEKTLKTIYLERNPVANEYLYRKTLANMLPSLRQIDASRIPGRAR
jgi:protein phosphatase 1 regulatory subunit 7